MTLGARLSDEALALAVGAALFAVLAWPIPFLDIAPYQDLPGHLATVVVIQHPERYPEYVFNGFLKTNAALVAWLYFVGKLVGLELAGRLFVLITIGATALAVPRFALRIAGGREKMLIASLFAAPIVHNWWISMGMLNFALSVAIAMELFVQLDRQRVAPTARRAIGIAVLAMIGWYAHVLPIVIVGGLAVLDAALRPSWRERREAALRTVAPLAPAGLLAAAFVAIGLADSGQGVAASGGETRAWESPAWVLYDFWAHLFYGMTPLSASSLVLCVVLAALAIARVRARPSFFSPLAWGGLAAACFVLPSMLPTWGYVNARFVPFVWMGALARVPDRLPRWLVGLLALSSALYVVGMDVDLFRVEKDTRAFLAGAPAVPEGARMLTLNFRTRVTSVNTWSLDNASCLYAIERLASAQDVWAQNRQMPISFAREPDFYQDRYAIRRFVATMGSSEGFCRARAESGEPTQGCEEAWRARWAEVWRGARGRFDRVLLWGASDEVKALVPPEWRVVHDAGMLRIVAPTEAASP